MQNDLVHGWGLDFALRRCVEVKPHSLARFLMDCTAFSGF